MEVMVLTDNAEKYVNIWKLFAFMFEKFKEMYLNKQKKKI